MVQTIKTMLKKSQDPHIAVLSYRATPHPWCGYSPAELCMGRRIRTAVPQSNTMLIPQWSYLKEFKVKNAEFKKKQKEQFDSRHGAKELPEISDDSAVCTLPWLYYILPWIHVTLLDSTTLYHGSTWLYFILPWLYLTPHDSTTFYHGST